jgi:hypothetical protein
VCERSTESITSISIGSNLLIRTIESSSLDIDMVKPHSPIAEVKFASATIWSSTKTFEGPSFASNRGLVDVLSPLRSELACSTRRVTFDARVTVKEITHRNNVKPRSFEKIWMSVDEYQVIKEHVKETVKMSMDDQDIDEEDDHYCTRGLEAKTKTGYKQRSKNKTHVKRAVFREQQAQREGGIRKPQFLADASVAKSTNCVLRAQWLAMKDALEVKEYLFDDA